MFDDGTRTSRCRKVGSVVHRELSSILQNRLADPRIGQITITEVSMSRDLKHAKVYVTSSEAPDNMERTLHSLNRAKSYIRHQLSANLDMKYTPAVSFLKDEVPERSRHVIGLIDNIANSES
ncbi:MAG: 30S ribosome-binding factor RbfA [Acidiferrobacterales bacterium]|nr:30S ribosome-binding factor RbfA [Acidiferrobacterales bacterium]